MTRLAKSDGKEQKKSTELIPVRAGAALPFVKWRERFEEMFAEMWPPFLPVLRLPDELAMKVPRLDVYEEGGVIVAKAELPGAKKEEIEVRISGNALTISGKREKEEKIERKDYRRLERSVGAFARTVTLPGEVDLEKVTASYKDGILEIRAPKVERTEPKGRKVEVT